MSFGSAARAAIVSVCVLAGSASTASAQSFVPTPYVGTQRQVAPTHSSRGVDEALGTFNETVPLEVPTFHEITPQLSLSYDSSAKTGLSGVGWSLAGVSRIERTSPGRGAPKYDATDTFALDGQEFVPCAVGSVSPSCTSGGGFSTKNENYAKISFDTTTSTWTVVSKDGTRSIYTPSYTIGTSVFRWGLSQVIDTKANAVTYTWAGNTTSTTCAFDCTWDYLDEIAYNGTSIKFYYEDRPDEGFSAVGLGDHQNVTGRLKTIDVTVSGSRARAYKLSYVTSGATGRSLLSSVQQFGKNATLDASGTVTGGTSLPAVTLGYQAGTPSLVAGTSDTGMLYHDNSRWLPMDVNGDGKTDLVEVYPYSSCFLWVCTPYWGRSVWLSNGNAFTLGSNVTGIAYVPNARYLSMDVNGDGKTDLVELYPNGANTGRRVWLSTGTTFTAGASDSWAVAFSDQQQFVVGDVNGDGKMDLVEMYPSGANVHRQVHLSNGTGFVYGAIDAFNNLGQKLYALDVNGDGKTDLVHMYEYDSGASIARQIYLSTGAGFVLGELDGLNNWGQEFLPMDVNGDGKEDMVNVYPRNNNTETWRHIWPSTGTGLSDGAYDGWTYCCSSKFLVGDVNGDGRSDMIEMFPGTSYYGRQIWLSTGSAYARGAFDGNQLAHSAAAPTQFLSLDVTGDGLSDMLELKPSGSSTTRKVWKITGTIPDLLTSVSNGWGGTTTVSYSASSSWANTNLPWVLQTPTTVTTNDGRGGVASTTYSYAGGLYDWSDGRFLGFRSVKETLPCIAGESTCPYKERTFKQDLNSATSLERIDVKSGAGTLLSSTAYEYLTNGTTIPRTSLVSSVVEATYTGAGTPCPGAGCKRTSTTYAYNPYGEVTETVEYGDADVSGDERTTRTTYVTNTSAYIVDKPSTVVVRSGVGSGGALLNETRFSYDGASSYSTAPTAGLLTQTGKWLSMPSSFVYTRAEYDSWGNLTAQIDELGARTTFAFDGTYHVFPIATVNALLQDATATWDVLCGKPTQTTNLNDQATSLAYDDLCRLTQSSVPGGKVESYSWVNVGNPATQYVQVNRPAADGTSHPLWSRSYFDGLQRTWRTAQKGSAADIYVDTAFNARGAVASQTSPYYAGQASYATATGYDALDRVIRITNADASYITRSYGLWSVTETDELGRPKTDRFNAYGNRVAHEEIVGGATKTTTYTYDARQNLAQTSDPASNSTTQSVDSLGRLIQLVDIDWGSSIYEHDAAGRLIATTDAKNQRTTFAYDALGRKKSKTTNAGTPQAATVSWDYDQSRATFFNAGNLTTMTDAAGTKTLDYDVAGRVAKIVRTINGTAYTSQYGYDAGDRPLWTIYPDGDTLGPLVYDSAGRVAAIPGYVTSASYDAEGNLTQYANTNGTVTSRSYSAQRGWLTAIATNGGGTNVQNLAFGRNAKGLLTAITSPNTNEGWTFAKDELDRLTGATNTSSSTYNQTLAYDAIGNITSNSRLGAYAYHATKKHAVTVAGANTYTYDATGLMTSGAGRTLTWNGSNQLATVASSGTTTTMTYDANGGRIMQTEDSASGSTGRVYLGDDYEITGSSTTKYVSLGDVLVARKEGTTKTWIHTDHLGSIQAQTNASGAEVHRKKYRPFGEILSTSGTLAYEPRGYTAQRQDASGLVYLHARFYDPVLGRFISPDRIIDGDETVGLNRYAYTANDPVDGTDVDGFANQRNVRRTSSRARPQTRAPSSNNSRGQNNNSSLNAARRTSGSGPGSASTANRSNSLTPGSAANANRSSNLTPVRTTPGAARTTQIQVSRDDSGGTWLNTQHSAHYFAPPPPPPPSASPSPIYVDTPVPSAYVPPAPVASKPSPEIRLVSFTAPLPQDALWDCLLDLGSLETPGGDPDLFDDAIVDICVAMHP